MEQIRSFIAIELPEKIKSDLARLQEKLKSAGSVPVKWVEPGNIHVTLKFLGYVDAGATGNIITALEEATQGAHPFEIEVSGLGVFPNLRRVQIIWVGLTGGLDKLGELQKRIEERLIPLGFPAEGRPFAPHLTIARVRDYARPDDRLKLGQLITGMSFKAEGKIHVNSVHLMKSQLTREGPIYSSISTIALK